MLPGTNLSLPRLGFGTSGLMARLDRRQSVRLLDAAYDAGITHFDTARLYGYGAAEGVVGEFIRGRRDCVTIASKVGILPPRQSRLIAAAKYAARRIVRLSPALRTALRDRAMGMTRAGMFDVPTMQQSLETSLRELRTDHLDILLLHDCSEADLARPDVQEFLQRVCDAGKTRAYGVASTAKVCAAARPYQCGGVLQFPSGAFTRAIEYVVPAEAGVVAITHSALGADFAACSLRLAADADMAREWSRSLEIDARDRRALASVFLAYALNASPSGCVLFSSTDAEHIRRNVTTASTAPAAAGQVRALLHLLDHASPRRSPSHAGFAAILAE